MSNEDKTIKVENVELSEMTQSENKGAERIMPAFKMDIVKDVKVDVNVRLGDADITVDRLFNLKKDDVVKLNQASTDPVELIVDGKIVALGNIVVVDDNFGVQITEVLMES